MIKLCEVVAYVKANKWLLAADASLVVLGIYSLGLTTFTTFALGAGGWYYLRCKQFAEKIVPPEPVRDENPEEQYVHKEERAEWLNDVRTMFDISAAECVEQLWPFISEIVWDIMKEKVEPAIQKQLSNVTVDIFDLLEAFHFKEFDLGDQPVRLVGINVVNDRTVTSKIVLDADLVYDGNAHVEAGFSVISFGVKDIRICGTIRIELDPVLAKPPLIGGVSVYFLKSPEIEFNLTKALNIGDIPGLHDIIKSAIRCVIDSFIVHPESYITYFGKEKPSGVLRGRVVSASGLAAKDKHIFGKDSSDPYVKVKIGDFRHKTEVIENSLSPSWSDESFMLFIEKVRDQKIEFKVKDEDDVGNNDLLGKAEVELKKICHAADGNHDDVASGDYVLPLEDGQGFLNCQLQWLHFTDNAALIKKQIESWSVVCVFIKLESATGLPSVERVDGVHVQISVGETTVSSLTKKNTTRPVWNEIHYFFVHNPKTDKAVLKVMDKDNNELGHVIVEISKLVAARGMMISDAFPLQDSPTKGLLRVSLDLKGLVHGPQKTQFSAK